MPMFRFKCRTCDEWHEGMPSFSADAPLFYYGVPVAERAHRCVLTSDTCVVDDLHRFVRGRLEVPVIGADEPLAWGVWVSLSEPNYREFVGSFDTAERTHVGPYFGWLSAALPLLPSTENLKTMVHLQSNGLRPLIELEPTDHPLAIEQRIGITIDRLGEYYSSQMWTAA
jgi:hypothetical protein